MRHQRVPRIPHGKSRQSVERAYQSNETHGEGDLRQSRRTAILVLHTRTSASSRSREAYPSIPNGAIYPLATFSMAACHVHDAASFAARIAAERHTWSSPALCGHETAIRTGAAVPGEGRFDLPGDHHCRAREAADRLWQTMVESVKRQAAADQPASGKRNKRINQN
jgi:hypothetical protein